MRRLAEAACDAARGDWATFRQSYRHPVLVVRLILGGDIQRRFGPGRGHGETARAAALRASTMAFLQDDAPFGARRDHDLAQDRPPATPVYAEVRRSGRLGQRRVVTVGRLQPADVTLADFTVSGAHAAFRLRLTDGRFAVMDLGSTNGTHVEGERIAPETWVPIRSGGHVGFGRICCEFLIPEHFYERLSGLPAPSSRLAARAPMVDRAADEEAVFVTGPVPTRTRRFERRGP